MNGTIVFYHDNCLDGFSGAWSAWKKLGSRAEYRGLSHGLLRVPSGIKGKDVFFVDYCPSEYLMGRILRSAAQVTVIDHHITHREVCKQAPLCLFALKKSGCVLAWEFFHPRREIPKLLKTIQDHDLFTLRRTDTLAIVTALALVERDFSVWDRLVRSFDTRAYRVSLSTLGSFLLQYKDVFVGRLIETAQPVTFDGHRAYAVNTHVFYSEAAARMYQTMNVHLGIAWHYANGRIKVSLRSDGRVNCAELATRYGGGGHVGAAGFWLDFEPAFPWKKI